MLRAHSALPTHWAHGVSAVSAGDIFRHDLHHSLGHYPGNIGHIIAECSLRGFGIMRGRFSHNILLRALFYCHNSLFYFLWKNCPGIGRLHQLRHDPSEGGGEIRAPQHVDPIVGAAGPAVHDAHLLVLLFRVKNDAHATHNRQGRAHHQHGVGLVDKVCNLLFSGPGYGLPEVDHVGLHEGGATAGAADHVKTIDGGVGKLDVAVRVDGGRVEGDGLGESGVGNGHARIVLTAVLAGATAQANNGGEVTVQRNHGAAAGGLVQAINVLGDNPGEVAGGFERR